MRDGEARLPVQEQLSLKLRRFVEANIPELASKIDIKWRGIVDQPSLTRAFSSSYHAPAFPPPSRSLRCPPTERCSWTRSPGRAVVSKYLNYFVVNQVAVLPGRYANA